MDKPTRLQVERGHGSTCNVTLPSSEQTKCRRETPVFVFQNKSTNSDGRHHVELTGTCFSSRVTVWTVNDSFIKNPTVILERKQRYVYTSNYFITSWCNGTKSRISAVEWKYKVIFSDCLNSVCVSVVITWHILAAEDTVCFSWCLLISGCCGKKTFYFEKCSGSLINFL